MTGNVNNRPTGGTWKLNNRRIVKYTPDALVFLNGDVSLPGCPRCRGRITIQDYVTSMSVEAGVSPTSHSATLQLSVPRVQGQQMFVDGYNVLRPGLEVHIYMRGYFQVRGLFRHLRDAEGDPLGRDFAFPNPTRDDNLDLGNYSTYPYYPVFHGVLTQVSYDYSDGFYTSSLQCASLLHFWQYQNITTAAAWLALDQKPNNDPGRPTLVGNNLNNMHPFGIIYSLYKDVIGAASGVEFALSGESNLDVADQTGATQIYDQMILYWTQRFKTRVQNLRMYGVNGQLFNSAQQAWLGSADTRDVKGLLPSPSYGDPGSGRTERDPLSTRWSTAKALGLVAGGTDLVYSPLINEDGDLVNMSITDIFAFSQNISEFGPTNLWQSTYQTKMDIAQQVTEVTGYEFYQDVDGDLVFKPPFYNLDTSPSRYYRLEDEDIVNITFTEKEPNATFVIVRGTWFKGIEGVVPNANGPTTNRSLYIDYKLVSKFGWRQAGTLDITYATDPKVLFWIGVARLDMLNVDTFSASCTIPIRPEMRPGYPVYIPFVDSYYYITQLSHSFAYGGQCTTNLVLNCRRSKFHAPGKLDASVEVVGADQRSRTATIQSAVNLIRLDRPDLPPRPLTVGVRGVDRTRGSGPIKVVGFPNVVLALDPRKLNPNFTVVGLGIDFLDQTEGDADLLFNMIARDVDLLRAFTPVQPASEKDGRELCGDPTLITRFRLVIDPESEQFIEFDLVELQRSFDKARPLRKAITDAEDQVSRLTRAVQQASSADVAYVLLESTSGGRVEETSLAVEAARGLLDNAERTLDEARANFERTRAGEQSQASGLNLLANIFEALQPSQNRPIRRRIDGIAGSDVTASYFETLSHLKNQYVANTLPGHYRYYSSAHPDPLMQGQPLLTFSDGRRPPPGSPLTTGNRRGTSSSGSLPRTNLTKTEFQNLIDRMQEALNKCGVTSVQAAALTPEQRAAMKIPDSVEPDGLLQRSSSRRFLSGDIAQNLVEIAVVADEIIQEAAKRFNAAGIDRSLIVFSTFRPGEAKASEAQHAEGLAIDIGISGSKEFRGSKRSNAPEDLKMALMILTTVAYEAMQGGQPKITGLGVYQGTSSGWFIHVDRRTAESQMRVRMRRAAEAGVPLECYPPAEEGRRKGRKGTQPTFWTEGFEEGAGNTFIANARKATPTGEKYQIAQPVGIPKADIETRSTALGDPPPEPDSSAGGEGEKVPPSPEPRARVDVLDVSLDTPRDVIQFAPTVTVSPNRVPPEAELTLGKTIKGLNLARGPGRAAELTTTDQIQTISFIRYEASKFSQVVGSSQTGGGLTLRTTSVIVSLRDLFKDAAGALLTEGATVTDAVEGLYEDIVTRTEVLKVIPVFDEEGNEVEGAERGSVMFDMFEDAVTIRTDQIVVPQVLEEVAAVSGDVSLSVFTLPQLSGIDGYVGGAGPDPAQATIEKVASAYANSMVKQVESQFNAAKSDASTPKTGRGSRFSLIQDAFNQIFSAMVNEQNGSSTTAESTQSGEKAVKEGRIEKPLHAPVFPVSDEKGYEHYGAYRYGRGLTVEPGGTFEFIHSGQDPFRNVRAQDADRFLTALTDYAGDKVSPITNKIAGIRDAAVEILKDLARTVSNPVGAVVGVLGADSGDSTAPEEGTREDQQTEQTRNQIAPADVDEFEASLKSLVGAVTVLRQTAQGQDTLRELLRANGDDPGIVNQENFSITQTQFARNFANFAVNYAKSPVFKTTVANAAYRLTDLTSHLVGRAGDSCVCRGSYSDVILEAYSQINFQTVEGIDTDRDKATAYQSETILGARTSSREYQDAVSGKIREDS